tara:strand:- start:6439 stop:9933 length:3495 start_codon:yes stop_codon:yes gene_type:complete
MATLPNNSNQIVGGVVPNVYIKRIILDNRSAGNSPYRGNDPHIDIPVWKPTLNVNGTVNNPPAWALANQGLLETPNKVKPSSWVNAQSMMAEITNAPLFIQVDFSIKEEILSKQQSVFLTNTQIQKFLKIAAVVSFSETYSNSIFNGTRKSILPSNPDEEKSVLFEISAITGQDKGASFSLDTSISAGSKIYNIHFSKNFSIDKNTPQHVTVFAQAMIDIQAIEEAYSVSMANSPFLEKFNGKIAYEPVIISGKPVEKSHYYKDTDDVVWIGEVEAVFSPGQFKPTVVKKGTAEKLTEVSTTNTVVQDFRVKKQFTNLMIDFSEPDKLFTQNYKQLTKKEFFRNKNSQKVNFFSNLFSSKNLANDVKVAFATNLENLYLHSSKYGSAWYNMNTQDKLKIFMQDTFKSITLIRRRLKSPSLPNSPSTIFDESTPIEIIADGSFNQNFALLIHGKQMGRFGRIRIDSPLEEDIFKKLKNPDDETNLWVWFAGLDESMKNSAKGYYQYGIRYTFEDKIEKLLTLKKRTLSNSVAILKKFYQDTLHPAYYNNITDSFTDLYRQTKKEEYITVVTPALVNFIDTHQAFVGGNYETKEKMIMMLQVISCPETGNPDGLLYVVKLIEDFLSLIERLVDSQSINNTTSDNSNTYSPSNVISERKSFSESTYWFKEVVDCSADKDFGYEFLRTLSTEEEIINYNEIAGLPLVQYKDFERRVYVEAFKYFSKGSKTSFLVNKEKEVEPGLVDAASSVFTYLAPSFVKTPNLGILSNGVVFGAKKLSKIDFNKLNLVLLEIYKAKLDSLDSSYKVNADPVPNLSYQQKQEKYQLNEIMRFKGGMSTTTLTPGVKIQKDYNIIEMYPIFDYDIPSGAGKITESASEAAEKKVSTPPMLDALNYNDALFFLTNVEKDEKNSHFHIFSKTLYDGDLSIEDYSQQTLPNHYKYLIKLHNPNDSPMVALAGENTSPVKNIVDLPFTSTKQTTSGKPAFGYKEGFLFLDSMEKKFGLWMNFFNLVEVRYLEGFLGGKNEPIFRKLTTAKFKEFKKNKNVILCKLVRYNNPSFGIKEDSVLELQTLDEYFLLGSEEFLTKLTGNIDFDALKETSATYLKLQKQLNTMANVPNDYMNTAPDTKALTKSQKNISPGGSPAGALGGGTPGGGGGGMGPGGGIGGY